MNSSQSTKSINNIKKLKDLRAEIKANLDISVDFYNSNPNLRKKSYSEILQYEKELYSIDLKLEGSK